MSSLRKTIVYKNGLRCGENVAWAKNVAMQLESKPNYWVPRDVIESEDESVPRSGGEWIVRQLYDVVREHLSEEGGEGQVVGEWEGAEYWAQVYSGGRGLAFHLDKDEYAMKHRREMVNPIYSSVLYLSGSKTLQSPTIVTNEHYDEIEKCIVPKDFPTCSTMVFPKENRYCIFDGRCGHGVLDTNTKDEDDVRVVFLVNWWRKRPEEVHRCPGSKDDDMKSIVMVNGGEPRGRREGILELTVTPRYLLGNEPFMIGSFLQSQGILDAEDVWKEKSRPVVLMRHSGIVMIPLSSSLKNEDAPFVDGALVSREYQQSMIE
ncbi:hypothetical protein PSENEW3n2_00005415 [Picochlorum sp. SENEW3]|nr:hypothetical protein PSENEW3n2_00005415 [Picochlorum sp. SENEW3]WPT17411.1 hypothetical protein PSENEW3_00005415 [Picochlorum sp. SENEW3]